MSTVVITENTTSVEVTGPFVYLSEGGVSSVTSFNSRTGAVTPTSGDYTADQITETATNKIMTSTERTKLSGIEAGANNYTHPASHSPSIITQDSDNRFVTDTEKSTWNAKQAALVSGTNIKTINSNSILGSGDLVIAGGGGGDMYKATYDTNNDGKVNSADSADSVAWANVSGKPSFATVATSGSYTDLSNKPTIPDELADLSEDSTHRVVTDAEKSTWNAKEPAISKNTAFNKNYGTTSTDVKMNGTQAVGTVDEIARIDHVHPTDTSRAASSHTHAQSDVTNLTTDLSGKQATLVSGTNIKTVNSTSLLGSGDVAVQATLVSATNIKTINSTTLLGSGDLAITVGHTIQDEGTPLTARANLNFVGTGVTVTDDSGNSATKVTINTGSAATTTVVNGLSSISNNNFLDIQPGAGAYWEVDNLNYAGAVEIYRSDGTNNIKIDADSTFGARQNLKMRASNSLYPRIKNVSGGDLLIGYNAIVEQGTSVQALSSIANGSYLDIQPGAGVEWIVDNIYYPGAVEIYYYDGTNNMKVDADTTFGARLNLNLRCTNSKYYRIKNVSGGSIYLGYDGRVTS